MKHFSRSALAAVVVSLACASHSYATMVPTVPEIDASTGVAALSLLGGAIMVIRGRRRKS